MHSRFEFSVKKYITSKNFRYMFKNKATLLKKPKNFKFLYLGN